MLRILLGTILYVALFVPTATYAQELPLITILAITIFILPFDYLSEHYQRFNVLVAPIASGLIFASIAHFTNNLMIIVIGVLAMILAKTILTPKKIILYFDE